MVVGIKNNIISIIFALLCTSVFGVEIDLLTAETLAIEASKPIRNTRAQINLAAGKNELSMRGYLPQLGLNYSSSRQVNNGSPDSETIQLGLNISQVIYDGGRMLTTKTLTAAQLELKSAALNQQIEQLRDRVWELFFGLLLNMEKLRLKRELLEISGSQLSISVKKLEMGLLTELDYLEAAIEVQNMELDVLNEQNNRDSLIKDFAQLTGHDPDYFIENSLKLKGTIDREYEGLPLWKKDYQTYEYYALIKNPVLKTKEAELRKLFTEYELSKTLWIPRLSLEGAIYLRGTVFPLQDLDGSLSLKIDFPFPLIPSSLSLGAGGQGENQVTGSFTATNQLLPDLAFVTDEQILSLNLRQSSEELDDSITELLLTIYMNIEQIEQQRVKMTILRDTQNLLQKRLNILETRYKMGEIKELNIFQARVDFYEGEIGIREGVITLLKAERELEKTLGLKLGELTSISKHIHLGSEISAQGKGEGD